MRRLLIGILTMLFVAPALAHGVPDSGAVLNLNGIAIACKTRDDIMQVAVAAVNGGGAAVGKLLVTLDCTKPTIRFSGVWGVGEVLLIGTDITTSEAPIEIWVVQLGSEAGIAWMIWPHKSHPEIGKTSI